MMRIDEAGHDDAPAGINDVTTSPDTRSDRDNLLALDHHVGLGEIAHPRIR
jgi:hypothetical protein